LIFSLQPSNPPEKARRVVVFKENNALKAILVNVNSDSGNVNTDSGKSAKVFTFDQNRCSR